MKTSGSQSYANTSLENTDVEEQEEDKDDKNEETIGKGESEKQNVLENYQEVKHIESKCFFDLQKLLSSYQKLITNSFWEWEYKRNRGKQW